MCKKREEKALVKSLAKLSGKPEQEIRKLIARAGNLVRDAHRNIQLPVPKHLVEELCITLCASSCRHDTPTELAQATISFLGVPQEIILQ